jgi:Peptidase family M20/M25/M40
LNPHTPFGALAPQASASANSATRTCAGARQNPCRPHHDSKSGRPRRRAESLPACSAAASYTGTIGSAQFGRHDRLSQPTQHGQFPQHDRRQQERPGVPADKVRRARSGGRCDDGQVTEQPASAALTAEDEVATLCSDLIRIDTSNYGDNSGPGERPAAEQVAALFSDVGLEPVLLESHWGRASVVTRIAGEDPSRPPLLIHGHLDVVPADAADWAVHPFSGEIVDGTIWGRGAVDMKDMDAMMLAVVRQRMREGRRPPRDVVIAFLADEEAGGSYGGRWLVHNHPDLFEGVTEAIGEVGGFSATVGGQRPGPPGTARCCRTTTRSPNSPRRWPGSGATSGPPGSRPRRRHSLRPPPRRWASS